MIGVALLICADEVIERGGGILSRRRLRPSRFQAPAQQARSVRIGWIPGYSRQMVKPFLEAARAALAEQDEGRYI